MYERSVLGLYGSMLYGSDDKRFGMEENNEYSIIMD